MIRTVDTVLFTKVFPLKIPNSMTHFSSTWQYSAICSIPMLKTHLNNVRCNNSTKAQIIQFQMQLSPKLDLPPPTRPVDKWYSQIVWSPFPYPITYHEGGIATERGEFSGLNTKPTVTLTIFSNNYFGLDVMNNPHIRTNSYIWPTSPTLHVDDSVYDIIKFYALAKKALM